VSHSHDDSPLMERVSVLSCSKHDDVVMNHKVYPLLLIAAFALASGPSRADDDHRQRDTISTAVKKGEILQLSEILRRVKPHIEGKILEIDFEESKDRPIYEFYVLDKTGRRVEYEIDARTGRILSSEPNN
jgi:uncharacterized membrane protein YkoI